MNTINDMKHSGTQAKHGQHSSKGKMLKIIYARAKITLLQARQPNRIK